MSKAVKELLVGARALLARPKGWCQGTSAKNVRLGDQVVVAYCTIGACQVAGNGDRFDNDLVHKALEVIRQRIAIVTETPVHKVMIARWNDSNNTFKKDVLDLFDEAIEGLKDE